MRDRLEFAIVGCGRVVTEMHLPAWNKIERANCRAVCDRDQDAAIRVRRQISADRSYKSVDDLLAEQKDLDFVVVATPGHTHVQITRKILEAGHHVLCEKPFTYERSEVEEISSLATRNGLMVCPIHNYRYKSNTRDALAHFGDDGTQQVQHVCLKWRGTPLEEQHASWLRREREHGLIIYDWAYHFLDVLQLLLGGSPEIDYIRTEATDDSTESITAMLKKGPRTASVDLRLNSPTSFTTIEIAGDSKGASLEYYPDGFRTLSTIDTPLHRMFGDFQRTLAYGVRFVASKPGWYLPQNAVGHYRLFVAFLDSIQRGERNPVPLTSVEPLIDLLERIAAVVYEVN